MITEKLAKLKKQIGVTTAAMLGTLIGLLMKETSPEIIVAMVGIVLAPFFLIEARTGKFGEETLHLSAGALVGATIGALSGLPAQGIGGALAGTSLVAIIEPIVRKLRRKT